MEHNSGWKHVALQQINASPVSREHFLAGQTVGLSCSAQTAVCAESENENSKVVGKKTKTIS